MTFKPITPYELALRYVRQRGTTFSDPRFIEAYLIAEINRVPYREGRLLHPNPLTRIVGQLSILGHTFNEVSKKAPRQSDFALAAEGSSSDNER